MLGFFGPPGKRINSSSKEVEQKAQQAEKDLVCLIHNIVHITAEETLSALVRAFNSEIPTMYANGSLTDLSVRISRIESDAIANRVVERLKKEFPYGDRGKEEKL